MAILRPDTTTTLNEVKINEYLLTRHNPNRIAMPSVSMEGKIIGVTVHNTAWITTAAGTTPAEQYTRATVNGNMKDVRVHYYVDNVCAWQNLPHSLSGWHAADGSGNGNRRTIAIECIMSSAYNVTDKKSEDNCARLAAALLKKYNLDINHLFTHTHWLNVRDGKSGTVDYLNTAKNPYKTCPLYILPHWSAFKAKVQKYLTDAKPTVKNIYRIRKSWADAKSQIGAYSSLENAKKACKTGYSVFDANGVNIYTSKTTAAEVPFLVKVSISDLNIRKGPGTDYAKTGKFTGKGVFTIVEVQSGQGASAGWGRLKSGAGWISLDYAVKTE